MKGADRAAPGFAEGILVGNPAHKRVSRVNPLPGELSVQPAAEPKEQTGQSALLSTQWRWEQTMQIPIFSPAKRAQIV